MAWTKPADTGLDTDGVGQPTMSQAQVVMTVVMVVSIISLPNTCLQGRTTIQAQPAIYAPVANLCGAES